MINPSDKITEQPSKYRHLEKMTVAELTKNINNEDKTVALAIEQQLPQLNRLIEALVVKLKAGGRLFYVGAGSGGRLSVLDAIEMPTTYGVPKDLFNVVLAGRIEHLIEALEEKEDDLYEGVLQLEELEVSDKDFVIGISASGTTPFVLQALKYCQSKGITTASIVNNPNSEISSYSNYPVEVITGPEFISGSTRMKCGTSQKMIFDMISTTSMVQLGRVEDNKMVYVNLINDKIIDRANKILMEKTGIKDYDFAKELLLKAGSVVAATDTWHAEKNKP